VPSRRRWLLALAILVAVVAVGLRQAPETKQHRQPPPRTPSAAEVRAKLAASPPPLASLHRQANALLPGQRAGLQARLRALRGHPVVVNVWAAWCGPCRDELPVFQDASLAWGTRVAFVGVDVRDSRASAERLLRQIPLTYPSFEDHDGQIANGYRLVGTPSTIYYDAAGTQTHIHQGPYSTRASLDADITRYALGQGS
jgi:cytochrome c biogenesis protein CcmG, thiol:disulfide interchange protein DsbE